MEFSLATVLLKLCRPMPLRIGRDGTLQSNLAEASEVLDGEQELRSVPLDGLCFHDGVVARADLWRLAARWVQEFLGSIPGTPIPALSQFRSAVFHGPLPRGALP